MSEVDATSPQEADPADSQQPTHGPMRRFWENWIKPFAIVVIVLSIVRSSLADWNDVPSGSMNPTILEGDRVFVNKLAYSLKFPFTTWTLASWSEPKRGQVVTFWSPKDGKRLIKRVAGVPGDRIAMRNGVLLVNDQPVPYADDAAHSTRTVLTKRETLGEHQHAVQFLPAHPSNRSFDEVTLGPDDFYMLGDNRDNSGDSRLIGVVPRDLITGHAVAIAVSVDRDTWVPRWNRFLQSLD